MNKIQRTSRYLRWFFIALMIITPIFTAISWLFLTVGHNTGNFNFLHGFTEYRGQLPLIEHPLTMPLRLLGLTISIIPLSIELMMYYNFINLFLMYEQGHYFNMENVAVIRKIGIYVLLGQLISPFMEAANTVLFTWQNSPGNHMLRISFESNNLGLVVTGLLIILISRIIAEGHRLNEEQRLTI